MVCHEQAICCDVCGYPRIGLPETAKCPECGENPPVRIEPLAGFASGAAQDRPHQLWLFTVAIGLILLMVTSIRALHVALIMPLGGLTLVAINAPGPKLFAATLLQRSIGDPGVWGIYGTMMVLGNVLAIWLITEPRSIHGQVETGWRVRLWARWSAVVSCGALLGVLLGGYGVSPYWVWGANGVLVATVVAVELPANALLYWHLKNLSERLHAGAGVRARELPLLRAAMWIIPAICLTGAMMSVARGLMQDRPVIPWRIAQAIYGAVALGGGVAMTVGVLHLTCRLLAAAIDRSIATATGRLTRVPLMLNRLMQKIRSDPSRWMLIAGIALWLWMYVPSSVLTLGIGHRVGLGGDLPSTNFTGPKIAAVYLVQTDSNHRWYMFADRSSIVWSIVAIWLITSHRPGQIRPTWATIVRWIPTLLMGLAVALGIAIGKADEQTRQSHWIAGLILAVELPSTLLVYLYLSRVALVHGLPRIGKQLLGIAVGAAAMIAFPVFFLVFSGPLRGQHQHPIAVAANAAYMVVNLGLGVAAFVLVMKLALAMLPHPPSPRLSSAAHDPSLPNPAA